MSTLREQNLELYNCWTAIKQRCKNPNAQAYHNYGGRDITYCDEWEKFKPFCEWALANGWEKGLDIDRIDNDGSYEPSNCRFVTRRENVNNRRNSVLLTVNGVTKPSTVWADEIGAAHSTLKKWRTEKGKAFAEEKIAKAIKDGYKARDYSSGHPHYEVKHLETGLVFRSISDAAKHFGVSRGSLSIAIRNGGNTKKGTFVLTGVVF